MSSFSDAGEIVTGGLFAGAVEPGHGRSHAGPHPGPCLNCGAALTGPYCTECGQNGHVHRTIGAIWHELMHGVLHFDGKIWRTLPELAVRPGELTRRYVRGERAKFVSPLALFLFSALLMYATYSLLGHHGSTHATAQESAKALTAQVEKIDDRIADAEHEMQEPDLSAARRAKLQDRIASGRNDRAELAAAAAITKDVGDKNKETAAAAGRTTLERMQTDREFVAYKLKANAYKFSWLLILISTPFVWLLFAWKRDYGLYDHAVFVTYSIAFMSLLFCIYMIGSAIGAGGVLTLILMGYALWHMYVQMKGAYQLSRPGALLRLPLLYGLAASAGGMFYGFLTLMS
jgi:hypothetical protein